MKIVTYNRGYKTYGAWLYNIPPRHKKRLKKMAREFNQARPKFVNGVINHINWMEFISIEEYTTRLYIEGHP